MGPSSSADYRARASARRASLQGGALGQEPDWSPRDMASAFAWLEAVRAASYALAGTPIPGPSTPEQRRSWPSGRIEDRDAP
jgi:hypothetical protein